MYKGWTKEHSTSTGDSLLMIRNSPGWGYRWYNKYGLLLAHGWICGGKAFARREARKAVV